MEDELPSDAAFEAASRAVPAKKGFSFPEKPKPLPQTDSASHLYIGGNIRLKGEITGCDMMRIEGTFEGTAQARQLVLCPGGSFLGVADIEEAEIEGRLDGTLNVRGRLFLRNKGRIRGTFSYGQLEIERGGVVEGRILPHEAKASLAEKLAEASKPAAPVSAILAATPPAAPKPVQSPVVQPPVAPQPAAVRPGPAAKPAAALNGSGVQ